MAAGTSVDIITDQYTCRQLMTRLVGPDLMTMGRTFRSATDRCQILSVLLKQRYENQTMALQLRDIFFSESSQKKNCEHKSAYLSLKMKMNSIRKFSKVPYYKFLCENILSTKNH